MVQVWPVRGMCDLAGVSAAASIMLVSASALIESVCSPAYARGYKAIHREGQTQQRALLAPQ
jgi:hypothetical protein